MSVAPELIVDEGWAGVLLHMGSDLTTEEWARQIGCYERTVRRACKRIGAETSGHASETANRRRLFCRLLEMVSEKADPRAV